MYDGAIGIKLCGGVARIVSKFFNQEFVSFAKIVLIDGVDAQGDFAEMLNQVG
jgi:hypothetical protein